MIWTSLVGPWCHMPRFSLKAFLVLEKKNLKCFYHIWVRRPSWLNRPWSFVQIFSLRLIEGCTRNLKKISLGFKRRLVLCNVTSWVYIYIIKTLWCTTTIGLLVIAPIIQGYTLFFLFLLKNIDCGYSLEPHHRGGSNEYLQSMFWAEIRKISEFFIWKYSFFGGKILASMLMWLFFSALSIYIRTRTTDGKWSQ